MKLNLTKVILFLLFCVYASVGLKAQETFIKRYKNTTLPEGSVAVANLMGGRILMAGNQISSNFDYYPIIVITDHKGNQINHFVDSNCVECPVYDVTTDSLGYVYVVGRFLGKAGIVKYDTIGNIIWQKLYSPNGLSSTYAAIHMVNNDLFLAGGTLVSDVNGGGSIIVAYNSDGDTLWSYFIKYTNNVTSVFAINSDTTCIYATGVFSDNQPDRTFLLRLNYSGYPLSYVELQGKKKGYGVIPFTSDSILIGGWGTTTFSDTYVYLSIVDSMGNLLGTIEDTTMTLKSMEKMVFDFSTSKLYLLDVDTIQIDNSFNFLPHISVLNYPLQSINQPDWEKTIYGTDVSSTRGLALANDGTIIHSGYASNNICPYLLKANENSCADLACDTSFVTTLSLPLEIMASLTVYPNPYSNGYLGYDIQSSVEIRSLTLQCFGINGQQIDCAMKEYNQMASGEIVFTNALAKGVYFLQFLINGQYKVYSRVVKVE